MFAGKKMNDFTNLLSPHDFKKNDDIILSYFENVILKIVLSAKSGGVSIILFTSIVGAPVGIASASLTLFFSLTKE